MCTRLYRQLKRRYKLYDRNNRIFKTGVQASDVQQNTRIGFDKLVSDLRTTEGKLDVWLLQGSERFASDPEVSDVLLKTARQKDTRGCLLLLGAVVDTPGLAERLLEALRPETSQAAQQREGRRSK